MFYWFWAFFWSPWKNRYQNSIRFQKRFNPIEGRPVKRFCDWGLRPTAVNASVLNLDCEKIDRENKTLQEVKGKSIEDKAKNNDAQKLNSKTETDAVKV